MENGIRRFRDAAAGLPLIAILRGLVPARALGVGRALVAAGFQLVEVPLNREGALGAIAGLRAAVPAEVVVGAGTVLTREDARAAREAGAELLVAPNLDAAVMDEGRGLGLTLMPGVMTPSEAFAARAMGAHALKLFPGEVVRPEGLKALRAVLSDLPVYAVGGVDAANMRAWRAAGADGVGLGSSLFKGEFDDEEIARRARAAVAAWRAAEGAKS